MSQIIPIYIPTYISDQNYNPSRVLPRLLFYNGMIDSQKWYFESGSTTVGGTSFEQNAFPYFDNYNVVSGSFPTTNSDSLLFFNEQAVYGETPTNSLYTEYWETYVELLYNPRTRLINASAIIPLADYFKMELNDIVQWRGNYYHLRAINDYNLKNGEAQIQLLGPILDDALPLVAPTTTTTTTVAPATVKIHVEEYNASPTAFFDLNVFANGETFFFSGDFSQSVAPNTSIVEMEVAQNSPSQIWGPYLTASATMTITDNGSNIFNNTSIYTSGSATYSVTSSVNFLSGHTYIISASNQPYSSCCTPTITSASVSGGDISIFFTTGSECSGCTATTIEKSVNGTTWFGANTAGCTSPRVIAEPTSSIYYRIQQVCGAETSLFSNSYYYESESGGTATLDWSFTETGGALGQMDLYVNGSVIESRGNTSSGTYTVYVGDTINVEVSAQGCGGFDDYANAYCTGIIDDADCVIDDIASIFTAVYTVQLADVGTTLNLDNFAACAGGCL
jgi:hypothetical protein